MRMTKTRDDAALATIKIRMHEPLRAQIERAAGRSGRSMNSEMVARLSRAFIEEDAVGGPDLRQIAYTMAAAFGSRGCTYAAADGRSAEPSHWIGDPPSYSEAMIAVIEALWAQYPGNKSPDNLRSVLESAHRRQVNSWLNSNPGQFGAKDSVK
jgi:hypothetical protein